MRWSSVPGLWPSPRVGGRTPRHARGVIESEVIETMIRHMIPGLALALLAACQPSVPDSARSGPTSTVANAQREAALAGSPVVSTLPAAAPVSSAPLSAGSDDPAMRPLPDSVTAAVTGTPMPGPDLQGTAANSGVMPLEASPSNPPPEAVNPTGISAEQDFDAVSATRTIESDAQKIAANRAQYTLVQPTELPTRPGTSQPNIVEYALRTNNPVGAPLYRRGGILSAQRHTQACARFASPDQAQTEFLSRGGPERDRGGLDPDGDGFACSWDPTPFRKARAAATGAAEDEGAPANVDPLAISSE